MTQAITPNRRIYDSEYVRHLFDNIAKRYDLLNHLLSLGFDFQWRRNTVDILKKFNPSTILDVATGTGDLAIIAAKLRPQKIIAIDPSYEMLKRAQEKIARKDLSKTITLTSGVVENLQFENNSFDAVMVAFGVRNFSDLKKGLKEILRVLKNDGIFIVLEFSQPKKFPIKQLYSFYSRHLIPPIGKLFSKNNEAYKYLPSTVSEFPDTNEFILVLREAGFRDIEGYPKTAGIVTIYKAQK
jgi:demethylmenaquinone methyltransferase/2-methoxy-6-polyprenyl-1,4-benzoquinol methylase